ncbi:Non-reducing polyketide synthase Preu4 [Xanthoria calcicola]
MRWLLNNRTDFGGGGWNTLLGAGNLHISVLDDVNHFTILQDGPKIKELAAMMARALHE